MSRQFQDVLFPDFDLDTVMRPLLRSTAVLTAASILSTASASAQAFNVDLNDPTNNTVPLTTFGAWPDQVGTWNAWNPPAFTSGAFINLWPVTGPMGTPPVTATTSTLGSALFPVYTQAGITPMSVVPLYGDLLAGSPNRLVKVENLLPGEYIVTLYSWKQGGGALWSVTTQSSVPPSQPMNYSTAWPGPYALPQLAGGDSMVVFDVTVGLGETIEIFGVCEIAGPKTPGGKKGEPMPGCVLNGFQLTPLLGTAYCPQPINSQGLEMKLIAWGTSTNGSASFAANDLTLALGVVESPLPILGSAVLPLVSIDQNPGVTLACPRIGTLCIGTSMGQNIQTLPPGVAQPDGTFSTQVDFGSLPPAWMIGSGSTLYFQAYYRDFPDPLACPTSGNTARLSNALEVMLVP